MLTSRTLGLIASALLVTSVSAAYYSQALPVYNLPSLNTPEPCPSPQGSILIIQDGNGFNASSTHGAPTNPWPKIHVQSVDLPRSKSYAPVEVMIDGKTMSLDFVEGTDHNIHSVSFLNVNLLSLIGW